MATKQEKQELMQTLKFTPRTYTLNISGYGGETYSGTVDRKVYDFFKSKKIDISQYAWNWDDSYWNDIPAEMRPFEPGSPYDCDNLFHMAGAELSDTNFISVYDETGNSHWETTAGYSDLEDAGVNVECDSCVEIADQDEGTVVFWGGAGEKGCFFEGEIELKAPFDPKKLTIHYEDCDDWCIISGVEYDGEEIDGSNGYNTTGKWNEAKWVIVGDEEVYEGEERNEDIPVLEGEEEWAQTAIDNAAEGFAAFKALADTLAENKTWNSIDTKPPSKGVYECKFAKGVWPLGDVRNAEWTGRSWKEDGKKAPEMLGWREIEEDPSDYLKQGYEE